MRTPHHHAGELLTRALDGQLKRRQLYALAALLTLPAQGGIIAADDLSATAWHEPDVRTAMKRQTSLLRTFAAAGLGGVNPGGAWRWATEPEAGVEPAGLSVESAGTESHEERAAGLQPDRGERRACPIGR